jgi:hypothetical protein
VAAIPRTAATRIWRDTRRPSFRRGPGGRPGEVRFRLRRFACSAGALLRRPCCLSRHLGAGCF